ncbi:MAG: hypothetical protein HGA45_00405 [Chloroflexales bacterium]|nr:hypothetical protein [Chloroflexales bacterium]
MGERVCWMADADLAAVLRRYYQGEAGLWGEIQARVHADLRAKGLAVAPRHLRFRRVDDGYEVIVEDASAYLCD